MVKPPVPCSAPVKVELPVWLTVNAPPPNATLPAPDSWPTVTGLPLRSSMAPEDSCTGVPGGNAFAEPSWTVPA